MSDLQPSNDSEVEYKSLSSFIALATTALAKHRPDAPVVAKTQIDSQLRTLQHVTTLLTTGTPRNVKRPANDPRVVAVTANAKRLSIDSIILVTENTRENLSPKNLSLESLKPDVSGDAVLEEWYIMNLKSHYKNVFAILEMFRTLRTQSTSVNASQASQAIDDKHYQFHLYIVNHAFPKITARILKGEETWVKHPIHVLSDYPLSRLHDRFSFPKTLKLDQPSVVNYLRDHYNILPQTSPMADSRTSSFQVTRDLVGQWVKVLTDTYASIDAALIVQDENGKRKSKNKLTTTDARNAAKSLLRFHALLRCKIVDFLLTDTALAGLMETKSRDIAEQGLTVHESVEDPPPPDGEEEDDVFVPDLKVDSPHGSILRYLKTIVAWTAAVISLSHKPLPVPIYAHRVSVPHPTITGLHPQIVEFKNNIVNDTRLSESQRAVAKIRLDTMLTGGATVNATVHAETLTMALSRSFFSTEAAKEAQVPWQINAQETEVLVNVFQAEKTPIAVSKKRCWCCWQLYRYWNPDGISPPSTDPSIVTPPTIVLLGAHSTIYPWHPPSVGIPIEFLRSLRNKLQEILIEVLVERSQSVGGKSGQSSARSCSGEEERLIFSESTADEHEQKRLAERGITP